MERTPTVAIAGAGIGGLTAALLLARAGFHIDLFERHPALTEAGAGIQITPNAGRVLDGLGLDRAIAAKASAPRALLVRSGRSGRRIVTMPLGDTFERGFGFPYRTIHRADLQRVLAEAVAAEAGIDVHLGSAVAGFATHERGLTAIVESGGRDREIAPDALIGADGARSDLRGLVPGAAERRASGRTAWRALVPAAALPAGIPPDVVGLWLGSAGHLVHYTVQNGEALNVVVVVRDEALSGGSGGDVLWRRIGNWAKPVQALLGAAPAWQAWPISTVDPSGAWTEGRFALLGDAAHAMAPFVAQGGAMAIEDAAVLARHLGALRHDRAAALAAYAAERRPRVKRVWKTAESTADLYHMGLLTGAVRNAGMRFLGGRALLNRYGWIYRWSADR
ncbi:MAG: FAD-dependent monooxygenase [Bauldia sp.]|nr:FAD-dependent monooxygenase [Bauldia sp.]